MDHAIGVGLVLVLIGASYAFRHFILELLCDQEILGDAHEKADEALAVWQRGDRREAIRMITDAIVLADRASAIVMAIDGRTLVSNHLYGQHGAGELLAEYDALPITVD